jgi:hypothetical protein
MPMVNGKKFAYTAAGKMAAKMEENKTGKKMVKKTAPKRRKKAAPKKMVK